MQFTVCLEIDGVHLTRLLHTINHGWLVQCWTCSGKTETTSDPYQVYKLPDQKHVSQISSP